MFIEEFHYPYRLTREETVQRALLQYNIQDNPAIRGAIYDALVDTFQTCFAQTVVFPAIGEFMQMLVDQIDLYLAADVIEGFAFRNPTSMNEPIALVWTPILNSMVRLAMEQYAERIHHHPYIVIKAATLDTWVELFTQTFTESVKIKPAIGALFLDACRKGAQVPADTLGQQYLAVGAMQDYFVRSLVMGNFKEMLILH
jgi:hypothetical protein